GESRRHAKGRGARAPRERGGRCDAASGDGGGSQRPDREIHGYRCGGEKWRTWIASSRPLARFAFESSDRRLRAQENRGVALKFAVIQFPGSNCDQDCIAAINGLERLHAEYVWHKEKSLDDFDAIVLPGGFAYGDY